MKNLLNTTWKILKIGGWAPLLTFATHLFLSRVLHAYEIWPSADIPVHFCGGLTIAFFVSQCFQLLPRESVRRTRVVILELLLIGSLTASAAVLREFAEFAFDRLFGTNIQISLTNTIQDLAMGILGAIVFMLVRSRQLRVGFSQVREIANDWIRA
jgi:hypothetical protein